MTYFSVGPGSNPDHVLHLIVVSGVLYSESVPQLFCVFHDTDIFWRVKVICFTGHPSAGGWLLTRFRLCVFHRNRLAGPPVHHIRRHLTSVPNISDVKI